MHVLVAMTRVQLPFIYFVLSMLLILLQSIDSTADVIDVCAKGMLELPSKVINPLCALGLCMRRTNISNCIP